MRQIESGSHGRPRTCLLLRLMLPSSTAFSSMSSTGSLLLILQVFCKKFPGLKPKGRISVCLFGQLLQQQTYHRHRAPGIELAIMKKPTMFIYKPVNAHSQHLEFMPVVKLSAKVYSSISMLQSMLVAVMMN